MTQSIEKTPFLDTAHAKNWLATVWFVHDPTPNFQAVFDSYIEDGMTTQQAKAEVWDAEKTQESIATYKLWASNEPIYSPFYVWQELRIATAYSVWRSQRKLPSLLSAGQAAYLLHYAKPKQNTAEKHVYHVERLLDPRNPTHPKGWTLYAPRAASRGRNVVSKIGKVYGTWKFTTLLSESESTADNADVRYKATCIACGAVREVGYRSAMKVTCRVCTLTKKPVKARISQPLTLYLLDNGTAYLPLGGKLPKNAVAAFRVTHYNTPTELALIDRGDSKVPNMQDLVAGIDPQAPKLYAADAAADYASALQPLPDPSTDPSTEPVQAAFPTPSPQAKETPPPQPAAPPPQPAAPPPQPAAPPPQPAAQPPSLDVIIAKDDIPL